MEEVDVGYVMQGGVLAVRLGGVKGDAGGVGWSKALIRLKVAAVAALIVIEGTVYLRIGGGPLVDTGGAAEEAGSK
jgi:hypothetical protein